MDAGRAMAHGLKEVVVKLCGPDSVIQLCVRCSP